MTKLYRGFNNNYSNLGVKPGQKGIWFTEDEEYAERYANMFVHGSVAEVDVDITKSKFLDEETGESIFGEDFNDLGCGETDIDEYICNEIIKMGYDGIEMEQKGSKIYLIVNRDILKNIKIIKEFENDPDDDEFMESLCEGLSNKPVSFTAYHGSVEPDMTPDEGRAFYLTDDYELAHQFARREVYDDGLYEGEIPTVFTFKGTFNNPYYLTDDEYDSEGQDSNIDYEKWVEMGVDGLVYEGQGGSTYYIVIDLSTIKLINKKVYWEEEIKDDDDIEESVNNHLLDILLESNILTEDIAAVKKYFPKVPEEKIQTLIELDPTYQGGDNLGKFGKWILGLYNKGNLKDEDFYKVPQYLTTFKDNLKKIQNKDIMSYKTLPDLAQAIQPYEGQKDESGRAQKARIKANEAEKVFNKNGWQIIVPKTYNASCYYGANTKWCTASRETSSYFENYTREGELYIIISPDGSKYQFHAQSWSFMDATDKPVAPSDVISDEDVIAFIKEKIFNYIDYEMENNGNTELNFLDDLTNGMNGGAAIYANLGTLLSCVFDWYGGNENQTGTFSELLEEHLRNDISNKYCDILRTMKFPEGQNIFEMIEDSKYGTIYEFFDDTEAQNGLNNIYDTIISNIENFLINKTADEFIKVKSIDIDDMDFFINVYDENRLDYPDDIKVDYFIKFGNISYGYSDGSLLDKMTTNMAGGRNFYADLVELFINDLSDMVKELCDKNKKPDMNEAIINWKNPFLD